MQVFFAILHVVRFVELTAKVFAAAQFLRLQERVTATVPVTVTNG